jgi:hypothetical protein
VALNQKCSVGRTRLGIRPVVGTGFCAHNGNLKGSWCERYIRRDGGKTEAPRDVRRGGNPFVLVN